MVVNKFEIWIVNLDPTIGSEIQKTRPAVIISPDEMNHSINTVIIAPMTTKTRNYPTRAEITFQGKKGQIALDQIRTIDKSRLISKIGTAGTHVQDKITIILQSLFAK